MQSDERLIYTLFFSRFTVSEIIRILNTAFNEFLPADKVALDYYPEKLRSQIDVLNEWIYPNIKGLFHSYLPLPNISS